MRQETNDARKLRLQWLATVQAETRAPIRNGCGRKQFAHPLDALRYHVSGAIARGEGEAIVEVRK